MKPNHFEHRHYTFTDRLCMKADQLLKNLTEANAVAAIERTNPASDVAEVTLTTTERNHSAGLMRVNHVGEVCAQALYRGQALTARLADTRQAMQQAALEEQDHLRWCEQRLQELNSHTSYLNPVWYLGAFTIGAVAGAVGDKWSLGFVAETEYQVVQHLEEHQQNISSNDKKSQAIIEQMRFDEKKHADMAIDAGAAELPAIIKRLMRLSAKVMTTTAYWI